MNNLRIVKIRKMVRYISHDNQIYEDTDKNGKFHQWIVGDTSKDVCGLVEREDGTMEVFEYNQIVFENEPLSVTNGDYQEKVKIPWFVVDLVNYTKERNLVPSDVLGQFLNLFIFDLPDSHFLNLRKLKIYFDSPCHRYAFEKACILGYEVE